MSRKSKVLIGVLIYLIGCILSYGRWNSQLIADGNQKRRGFMYTVTGFSWPGLLAGIVLWEDGPFLQYK